MIGENGRNALRSYVIPHGAWPVSGVERCRFLRMVLRNIFGKPMFSVLHSSAGAGKTHALVKNYLQIGRAHV